MSSTHHAMRTVPARMFSRGSGHTKGMGIGELLFVYILGGLGYGGIEMLWQGQTHWTMLLLGGLCYLAIYGLTVNLRRPLLWKWLLCALVVTGLEFCAGCLLNLWLGWDIWDYTGRTGNVLGQICPFYALCWFVLSIPASALAWAIRRWIFKKEGTAGR